MFPYSRQSSNKNGLIMLRFRIFFSFFAFILCIWKCSGSAENCGKPKVDTFTGNDTRAQFGQFPWHVAIYTATHTEEKVLICGGTLVAPKIVLTAAHCFYDMRVGLVHSNLTDYFIVAGKMTRNFTTKDTDVQKVVQVADIVFYDRPYNPKDSGHFGSDIAIIVLNESIPISADVLPACLANDYPTGFDPHENNTIGVFAGWGFDEHEVLSENLKNLKLPFVPYKDCIAKTPKGASITFDKFCAGSDHGPKPGKGDGGGGLVFKNPVNHQYYLRGICSVRARTSDSSISGFTDVSYFLVWIDRLIRERA